ncbi:Gfo/Idh/MocA family oxidoreductase [Luteolibacter sp. SL250]|uniref:Gfo/Idh/MocA family protein n=1 Tax=Luteolibacter sp. SL250 TaxID=2995170 RepID=UPI002271C7E0|nr:Gfo/Idh/MocA family oxidoreductase [Luteolibacter sp. SL250]WAC20281.1 Gfo/Idh/MocA family oxidoreductase [Luteolibacter sp. SL250]
MHRRQFLSTTALALAGAGAAAAQPAGARISAAQIGTGHSHASGKMQAMRNLPDLYQVTGICEPDDALWQRGSKNKAYADLPRLSLDQLLSSDVKLIAVETLLEDAPAMTIRCLEAGKHVHLDKPGALSHADFRKLRMLSQEKGLHLQMGYMLRYNPAFQLLFQAHREGWLGKITSIDAAMGKLAEAGLRKELASLPGGGMFELACHLTDAVVTLLGKPQAVHSFSTPTRDDGMKDNQLAVLSYPQATATLRCNHADPFGSPHRAFHVIGTKGSMEISPLESGNVILSLTEDHPPHRKGRNTLKVEVPKGRYDAEFIDMAKAIRGEKPLAWDAMHDIVVHETILRSSGMDVP